MTDIVDSNPGRSSSAIAVNSLARGSSAAIASQIAGPLLARIGDGWFYTGESCSHWIIMH